jgi:hypothetical protein
MRNTNRVPVGDFAAEFVELVRRKHNTSSYKAVLQSLSTELSHRYAAFHAAAPRLERLATVVRSADQIEALRSCYVSGKRFHNNLRGALGLDDDTAPVQSCPYCQLAPVGVWDHFLPSSAYPDFFVHPLNLIRACSGCNQEKGDRRVTPERQTIHPYFDRLDVQYLQCTVDYIKDFSIEFVIRPDVTADEYCSYTHTVVESHFNAYGLARKFRAEASRKINDFRTNMAKVAERGQITTEDVDLELRYEVNKALFSGEGPNSWTLALWNGLGACPNLVSILNQDPAIQRAVQDAAPLPAHP